MSTQSLHSLSVRGPLRAALADAALATLPSESLTRFLLGRRWFGGKARRVAGVRVEDWGDFPAGPGRTFLTLLAVEFEDGTRQRYFLPLGVTAGQRPGAGRPGSPRHWWWLSGGPGR